MATIINDDDERMVDDTYVSYTSPVGRFVWFLLWVVNTLIGLRFILRLFSANTAAGFTDFIYNVTRPLVAPFVGVVPSTAVGTGTIEWFALLAMLVYWLLAWAIVRLFSISRPVARY